MVACADVVDDEHITSGTRETRPTEATKVDHSCIGEAQSPWSSLEARPTPPTLSGARPRYGATFPGEPRRSSENRRWTRNWWRGTRSFSWRGTTSVTGKKTGGRGENWIPDYRDRLSFDACGWRWRCSRACGRTPSKREGMTPVIESSVYETGEEPLCSC